jgi:hypothetical protein
VLVLLLLLGCRPSSSLPLLVLLVLVQTHPPMLVLAVPCVCAPPSRTASPSVSPPRLLPRLSSAAVAKPLPSPPPPLAHPSVALAVSRCRSSRPAAPHGHGLPRRAGENIEATEMIMPTTNFQTPIITERETQARDK